MADLWRVQVGERLRAARVERGVGMKAVIDALGVAKSVVVDIESGRGTLSLARLIAYARALGVAPLELVPELGASHGAVGTKRENAMRDIDVKALVTVNDLAGRAIGPMIPELRGATK